MKKPMVGPIAEVCKLLSLDLPDYATADCLPSSYTEPFELSFDELAARVGEDILPRTDRNRAYYLSFTNKYKSTESIRFTETDLNIFFLDWFLYCKKCGFNSSDYFDYCFFEKEPDERYSFLSNTYRDFIRDVCNNDSNILQSKPLFNAFFADHVERKWLDMTKCDYADFKRFIRSVDTFFAKPMAGTGGVGACVIRSDSMEPKELYSVCKKRKYIVEEVVKNCDELRAFNEDTLNTIRVYTLLPFDNEPVITGAFIRFGRKGKAVDNFHGGGVGSVVDPETGVLLCDAVDMAGFRYATHPDSALSFKGFRIPHWDRVVEAVKASALQIADYNRHVGWDVAVNQNGNAELIEGNSHPNFDAMQCLDQVGRKRIYDQYIPAMAAARHVDPFVYPEADLSIPVRRAERVVPNADLPFANAALAEYEYKAPDYDYVDRGPAFDDRLSLSPARYEKDHELWRYKNSDASMKASVMFTGDITCFGKQFAEAQKEDGSFDFRPEFSAIRPIFEQSDLVVGNLETMIFPSAPYRSEKLVSEQNYYCNAPVEFLDAVRYAGFDMVTNANNHDLDTGAIGIGETIDHLDKMGLIHSGTFKEKTKLYEIFEINGLRVAVAAFTTNHNDKEHNLTQAGVDLLLNNYTPQNARKIYRYAKKRNADFVFACIHWGTENVSTENSTQTKAAQVMADIGYDAIIGSHPHVLQPFTTLTGAEGKTVPVFYSLGNFVSHNVRGASSRSAVACLDISKENGVPALRYSYIPIYTSANFKSLSFVVVPLSPKCKGSNAIKLNSIKKALGKKISERDIPISEYNEGVSVRIPPKVKSLVDFALITQFPAKYDDGSFVYMLGEKKATIIGLSPNNEGSSFSIPGKLHDIPVTEIADGAFRGSTNLRKMNLRKNVISIGEQVFADCPALEGVQFGVATYVIHKEAFANCSSLSSIVLVSTVYSVKSRAFANCVELRSAVIPSGVRSIADDAFVGCDKLVIYCPVGSYAESYAIRHGIPFRNMVL